MIKNKMVLKNNNKGFTLLEVLMTLLILGIVISAIFVLFDFGVFAYNKGTDKVEENAELRLAALRMTGELVDAFDVEISDVVPTGEQSKYFYCDTDENQLIFNDGGTLKVYSSRVMEEIRFQIRKNEKNLYDGDGNLEGTQFMGYIARFEIVGIEGSRLESEVLLNNMLEADYSGELDTYRTYIGFNHDFPF